MRNDAILPPTLSSDRTVEVIPSETTTVIDNYGAKVLFYFPNTQHMCLKQGATVYFLIVETDDDSGELAIEIIKSFKPIVLK